MNNKKRIAAYFCDDNTSLLRSYGFILIFIAIFLSLVILKNPRRLSISYIFLYVATIFDTIIYIRLVKRITSSRCFDNFARIKIESIRNQYFANYSKYAESHYLLEGYDFFADKKRNGRANMYSISALVIDEASIHIKTLRFSITEDYCAEVSQDIPFTDIMSASISKLYSSRFYSFSFIRLTTIHGKDIIISIDENSKESAMTVINTLRDKRAVVSHNLMRDNSDSMKYQMLNW